LINNNVIVISPNIEGIIGDFAYNSDGEFTFTKVNNDKKSYYINGDTSTKDDYPLIYCDDIEKCKLMAVDVPGYYLNIPGQASGVLCTSKSKCQVVGSENATSDCNNNIGKVILSTDESTAKFCNDNNGIELKDNTNEYLVTVTGSNFPGVTTTSNTNIAVKLDWTDKTIKIVKKNSQCINDNDIIIKGDDKFYYCSNNQEIEMKNNGAKFVNKDKDGKYQLIQIHAMSAKVLTGSETMIESKYFFSLNYYLKSKD